MNAVQCLQEEIPGYAGFEPLYLGTKTAVYRAIRTADRQPVIIKVLQREYPSFNELLQWRNQYVIAKNLPVPGIVIPYHLEHYRHSYALVMEDFGGISLKEYTGNHPLTIGEFLAIALQLADILHGLYQHRVIHKDLKPTNILINPKTQQVKLIDFSIASLLPKETQEILSTNTLEGTLAYIAPEQTGRMNRGIDYRSDFYSLGVVFYELLTGQLPFQANDPMELVHCHIAKPAPQPSNSEEIPSPILEIVMKLMAKNIEDRYQSALGLKHDLQQCQQQWQQTQSIAPFTIGQKDIGDRFSIPEKLYGRQLEVQTLLAAFDRVSGERSSGRSEMILVAGLSGIGKTAVVNEVHKPIVRHRGYFIKGKYDQFGRNTPFSAFVQAFRDLMEQLLSESDTQLQTWKALILEALGQNGQIMIEVIPELERIIGSQPAVTPLSGEAAQNRFHRLFQNFISVFTSPHHPLVIFIDDLQWIDSASLKLMQQLTCEAETHYLLFIGAYRDNEVTPAHPLMQVLEEMQKAGAIVNTITLSPLDSTSIQHLVADTLNSQTLAQPLAELVMRQTQGNPFFATQFLKALHEEGLITFNENTGSWECDRVQVRSRVLGKDVVEFMALQLQKLPARTQNVLKLAACIGNQFDLPTLAIVSAQSQTQTLTDLWQAIQEGLIIPLNESYKFYHQETQNIALGEPPQKPLLYAQLSTYRFLHDRVQQAAYSLIPEDAKQLTHLTIGQLLLNSTTPEEQQEKRFEIVNQLNQGIALISSETEREQLAQLNLAAGQKAKASTAYAAAMEYLTTGIQLLAPTGWQQSYALTLALHELAAEVAGLSGCFPLMEQLIEKVLQNARHLLDTVKVYEVKILADVARSRQPEAIQQALLVLEKFNVVFPEQPTPAEIEQSFQDTQMLLAGKPLEALLELPEMVDPEALAVIRILSAVTAAVYQAIPALLPLIVFKQVQLSIQRGNAPVSTLAYAWYGVILCGVIGEIDLGNRAGQLALDLLARGQNQAFKASTINMVYPFVKPWKHSIQEALNPLLEGYHSGLEMGALEYAAYCAYNYGSLSYFLGKDLVTLQPEMATYSQSLAHLKQTVAHNYLQIFYQSVLNLGNSCQKPWQLVGEAYDEVAMLPLHRSANDLYALGTLYINKLILSYLFQEWEIAVEVADRALRYLEGVAGCFMVPIFHFYDSLTQLAVCSDLPEAERDRAKQRVSANQAKLKRWAEDAPMNHLHKFYLVEAEQYRVSEQIYQAMEYYDLAIAKAKANGYLQEEALANELAARFYRLRGKDRISQDYLIEAYYCYARWNAKAKTEDLERCYPQLLQPIVQQRPFNLNPLETVAKVMQNLSASCSTHSSSEGISNFSEALDFASLIEAAQAISSRIELNELIASLTQILLKISGAEKSVLILPLEEGLQVRAITSIDRQDSSLQTLLCAQSVETCPDVPKKLIYYVKNTQQTAIVNNLQTHTPGVIGHYMLTYAPKSALGLPIVNQGHLAGILYLENQLTQGVFTSERLLAINLLASQVAISLENARLYQQAQNSLSHLQQMQLQLVQSEKMSALGNLVSGVAHEINNPVGFIAGNLEPAQQYIQDLLGLIELYQQKFPNPDAEILDEIEAVDLDYIRVDFPKLLESMQLGVERIRDISNSLRVFSRADRDDKVSFNLHEGIESTLLILKHRLKANEFRPAIAIVKEYGDIPPIYCFPGQMNQVFMNILANAIDALNEFSTRDRPGENSAPNYQIILRTELLDRDWVKIVIADNGVGISETVKQHIFDHLFTTKPVGQGTGLGLAIARQIVVDKHGGSLEVSSVLGEGTVFEINLPIKD
ncbi:AAA family ATPase [Desertifilum sp. FACHB-1129]|uniref:histidine kinase n=2 Tax=Desertifilum tharense IPPAS B-1220 TaxID=1781255 RepID=A0A1E5QJG0_9CYAN|nr:MULTISPECIES: ATP-binding sensor histidine kinase [Desertifilum]MDA0211546.1 AAA family ATPase [Cyanobacteria bacterium FC1]MBD2310070.1 AAA family ATPase [Desertifilum sp. FACHB-1129]MBD2322126.1 AAA family ATPase [Desertifilum sp. FACHB-866]MBD2333795.1 AAA family ATPase [Desertifilum sp. FACHB-868]OEJ74758.1 serine/threonine protein kinase [Desertifilum tharense IPPAS B-1220]